MSESIPQPKPLTPEELKQMQMQVRATMEMQGILDTKKGLIMYYTTVLGLSASEAIVEIKAECELRGIDFTGESTSKLNAMDNFILNVEKLASFFEKYPAAGEMAKPFVVGAATALTSAFIGKKAASSSDDDSVDIGSDDVVIESLDEELEEKK